MGEEVEEPKAALNTDRELWREPTDQVGAEYYQPSIHVTEGGGIGINVSGHVIVLSLRAWHALAKAHLGPPTEPSPDHLRHKYEPHAEYPWFCEHCGYPEYETLKHTVISRASGPEGNIAAFGAADTSTDSGPIGTEGSAE